MNRVSYHVCAMPPEKHAVGVLSAEKSDKSTPRMEPRLICQVCHRQFAKYSCPRCNARYCSLPCYRGHGERCTEQFAQENASEEMRATKSSEEDRRTMIEILRRVALDENGAHTAEAVRSGTSTPEEDEVGSSHALSEETASRIEKKLARGEEILESDLSLEEWRRFVRDISAGRATASLLTWSPWWLSGAAQDLKLSGAGQALIRDDSTESEASSLPGAWDVPLPPLSSLTRAQPSPHLATLLVGALHGYVSAARLYLGDWVSEPSAASSDTLSLSPSLLRKIPADTVRECLAEAREAASGLLMRLGSETALARQQALTATADTAALAGSGRGAVLTALADMRRALGSGADCLSERGVRNAGTGVGTHGSPRKGAAKEKGDRRKARAAVKRIEFLASWCAEFVEEQRLQELSEEIWGDYEEASRLFGTSSGGVENVVLGMGGQSGRGRGERGCGRRPAGLVEDWDGSVAGDEGKGGTEHEMMERQDKGGERKGRGPGQDIGKGKREWASQARMGKSEGRSPTEGKGRVKRGAGQAQDPDACDSHVEEGKEEVELLYELD